VHDFPDPKVGKAIRYGVYGLGANSGWVSVGSTTTPRRSRWPRCAAGDKPLGWTLYPRRPGCWSPRTRADPTAIGSAASKPRGDRRVDQRDQDPHRPQGPAELDRGRYPLGIKVRDHQLAAVPIRRHQWHGEWNYAILPRPHSTTRIATLPSWTPGRFLPVAGWRLTVVVVMVVDDAGTGRSQPAGARFQTRGPGTTSRLAGPMIWRCRCAGSAPGSAWPARSWWRTSAGAPAGSATSRGWSPWGTDGRELPVDNVIAMDARLEPAILAPSRRAAAPISWAGWCGEPASGRVRVHWLSGAAVVEVQGHANRTAPTPASRPTSRRRGSTPWTDRPAPPGSHDEVEVTSAGFLRTVRG
jgi:Rhodopirellula transposase DDE domain